MYKPGDRLRVNDLNGDREARVTGTGMKNGETIVFLEEGTWAYGRDIQAASDKVTCTNCGHTDEKEFIPSDGRPDKFGCPKCGSSSCHRPFRPS